MVRTLQAHGAAQIEIADLDRYDLRQLDDIRRALRESRPDVIIHLAARVGMALLMGAVMTLDSGFVATIAVNTISQFVALAVIFPLAWRRLAVKGRCWLDFNSLLVRIKT